MAPVFAQTVDQLIERIEKLEAAVFPVDETAASGLTQPSSLDTPVVTEPHAKVTDGQWDPSMGMCHNSRPCMKTNSCGKMCDASVRASKGWVKPPETAETAGEAVCRKRVMNAWGGKATVCRCGLPAGSGGVPCKEGRY